DGGTIPLAEDAASGTLTYRTAGTLQPGAYRWSLRDAALDRDITLARTAVNFPDTEMDCRAIDPAIIDRWTQSSTPGGFGRALNWAAIRDGIPLWPWCLAAALALFTVEGTLLWMDSRSVRKRILTPNA
ncbi:MAG: hypothetical protein KDL87_19530, partial [Verrucomicrobiae bacterium]|nr:hypothetical protein [Verrucomicrobiae bacterium]